MRRVSAFATTGAVGAFVALAAGTLTPTTAVAATSATTIRAAAASSLYASGPYRSDTSEAAKQASALATSDPSGAAAAQTIAKYPVAIWLGDWTQGATLTRTIDQAIAGAERTGTTAVFVTYAIPQRDCGGYSAGGFDEATYDAWVDQIVARVAGHRAAVIVEPDSLAMLSNTACSETLDAQRYRILAREVAAFTAAGVPAYLDAGNSNWVPPAVMASRLNSAGVQRARGFFTNVANYYPTAQEQAYAEKVSAVTGGSHYVIDTSRNGQGWRGTWCNGPGSGLGTTPRVVSDGSGLDALLWVKTPGASDGTCNGGPAAGKWWSAFAKSLVANARLGTPVATAAPARTAPSVAPTAHRDRVASTAKRRVTVSGWTFDRDDLTKPVTVRVTVGGKVVGTATANTSRPDVDRVHRVGRNHGFQATVAVSSGKRSVCLTAVGIGRGGDTSMGCTTVTVR
ncbi:MAG: glycoside hydrolase family 6 protein [Curtobacterium sp.]